MKKENILWTCMALMITLTLNAQTNPAITSWLINTTGIKGSYYLRGNSTPIPDDVLANVQLVQYSNNYSFIHATGVPAYITGPFLDRNMTVIAEDQNTIYRIPLNPVQNASGPSPTNLGPIGVFINGVAIFDYQDAVSWSTSANAERGGPLGGRGDGYWNRDAILAERSGFDCVKGHPAMGLYHHHQNPSAFSLDINIVSDVCDIYASDGLYVIDSMQHSPLLGFALDGFPIYGAYAYENTDGTGNITRMKTSYRLRDISTRTTAPTGEDVPDGPAVNEDFPLGYFREGYEYIPNDASDVLDENNGRFCITPEYPDGIYAYFCTVDENWNSAFPYIVGSYYGEVNGRRVNNINVEVTTYEPMTTSTSKYSKLDLDVRIFPNPSNELIAIQVSGLTQKDLNIGLYDLKGQAIQKTVLKQGSTIWYLDTRTLYSGTYLVQINDGKGFISKKVVIQK